jgi:hypothetical protein
LNDRNDACALPHPIRVGHQCRVAGKFVQAECLAECLPLTVGDYCNKYCLIVCGRKSFVNCPRRDSSGHWIRGNTCHRILRHVLANEKNCAFEERGRHHLALTRALPLLDRRQHADHAEHSAHYINDRSAGSQRPARRAGHIRKPTHHLCYFVKRCALRVRSIEKALGRTIDQSRVALPDVIVTKTDPVHGASAKIFDEDIRIFNQAKRGLPAISRLEVEANTALIAVVHREVARPGTGEKTCLVAPWWFDFDDVRTQVGKHQSARWAHDHVSEFNYTHSFKRPTFSHYYPFSGAGISRFRAARRVGVGIFQLQPIQRKPWH